MNCSSCNATDDPDARFCSECGKPVSGGPAAASKGRRVYLSAFLLVPVVILAAAAGYYKYFLPQGIAAVVNGENILLSELDAAVAREQEVPGANEPHFRYQLLNGLITERLMHQEARKAGITVSEQERAAALDQVRRSAALSGKAFDQEAASRFGSVRNFEDQMARRLLINKFIASRVIPPDADPRAASAAMNRWMQEVSGRASVRVTLAEQWSGAGCSCCNNRAEAATPGPVSETAKAPSPKKTSGSAAEQASQAALSYWQTRHGQEQVTTKVTDFGCHLQVDIIKDDKTIASLRYQGGTISE